MEETRALLDALMGPNRNKNDSAESGGVPDFAGRTVCKNFLVGFCPHDWFSMPKRALMPCSKIHSELMKERFDHHSEAAKYRAWYEEDFLNYLQPIARDCDTFIVRERAKCRPKSAGGKVVRMPPDVKERFDEMEKRYADLVRGSEEAADTSVAKSKELMGQAMVLNEELDTIRAKYTTEFQGEDICEVCGVKYPLGGGGAEWHDKQSHMKGKTHQGFAMIRAKIDELLGKRKEWDKYRSARRKEYEPMLQREREEDRPRERQRDREKDKERARPEERAAEAPKEREKAREKERSRGRDRPKSSAKESEHRDRDRDRAKERSRSRAARAARPSHRERSGERSRSRRRGKDRSGERSRSRRRKEKGSSSERSRSRRKKVKEKVKGGRSDRSSESSRERTAKDRGARRSPSFSKDEPKPEEGAGKKPESSSDEESQPEDEKDGITVLEEDLPEFWDRIQKLKAEVRNEAVAVLSTGTKERLERWLLARVRKKGAA